jgi:hypothetical protein
VGLMATALNLLAPRQVKVNQLHRTPSRASPGPAGAGNHGQFPTGIVGGFRPTGLYSILRCHRYERAGTSPARNSAPPGNWPRRR